MTRQRDRTNDHAESVEVLQIALEELRKLNFWVIANMDQSPTAVRAGVAERTARIIRTIEHELTLQDALPAETMATAVSPRNRT